MPESESAVVGSGRPRRTRTRKSTELAASPTLRRRRIARALLQLREAKGLTARQAATEAKNRSPERAWSETKVTRIETRKILRLRDVDVQTLLDVYGVTDSETREAYRRLAREASQTGWWVGYRDVLGSGVYVDLETEASRVRTFELAIIPGILQTAAYARALIAGGGIVPDDQVERRVEARMMRKQILGRPDSPRIWAIIDEGALHRIPAAVRSEQLRYLIDVQRPDLRVQVLPSTHGPHAAMAGAFTVLDFPEDPSVVYLEQARSELLLEDAADLAYYTTVYDHVQAHALSPGDSRALIESLV